MTTPFELLTKEELITAAIATRRPVAFLIGSPLSLKDGVGVPGVTEILDFVRDEVRERADFALPRFETSLNGRTGGDAYQEAMKWLGKNMGQDAINDVIKTAVLKARKDTAPALTIGDGYPLDWNIPAGTVALGEMVAGGNEKFLGPVLTTNFDPLISLAVRNFGGRVGRQVLNTDGTLAGSTEDEICTVVHIHGFWRDSDTLHTQAQLTNPRPKLKKSLQRLLQRRTLIVAAYGGWDDAFTQALFDLMNDEQAPLDVLWCFYEDQAEKVEERYGKLLAGVRPAIVMNRFRAFGGIDCHSIFGDILSTLRRASPIAVASSTVSPLAGWEFIDSSYLGALPPLRPEEIIRFFDGATPTLRHAACADIPTRAVGKEIVQRLADAQAEKSCCSFQLIRAAGGEGKTTLILQAAAAAAKSGIWNVLWRPAPRTGLPLEHILSLDPAKDWLIVADDAENLINDLSEAARLLHEAGRFNVHFLIAARDIDWRYFKGDRQSWGAWLKRHPDILLRELSKDDANMLVGAWQNYGADGLRALASLPCTDKQVTALLDAVHDAAVTRNEGSLFGGLLTVRFEPDGLRSHVVSMLTRLKTRQIKGSERNLFDALVYVAAFHSVGIQGIEENVLADLVGVPREWVQTLVVSPLGEEAAAVRNAGYILTRHSKVAAAIVDSANRFFDVNLAEVWVQIIRQVIACDRELRLDMRWFSQAVLIGPRLQRELPEQLPKDLRNNIAIAAAQTSQECKTEWLGCTVNLGKTYRNAGDLPAASQLFRDSLPKAQNKVDFHDVIRGYWYEWGMAESSTEDEGSHRASDAWLQGLSLADHLRPAPISADRAKLSFAGLGVAFGKLAESQPDCPFSLARRAVAYLGRLTTSDTLALGYFDKYDRAADQINTSHPKNIEEAIAWLTTAVIQAGHELLSPFLKALLKPEQVSFDMLLDFLKPTPHPRPSPRKHPQRSPHLVTPLEEIKPLQLRSDLDERIKAGIERVLTRAWESVPNDNAEDRFMIAKQKASKVISGLSPKIKRQVGAYFETRKWHPLAARDPKL